MLWERMRRRRTTHIGAICFTLGVGIILAMFLAPTLASVAATTTPDMAAPPAHDHLTSSGVAATPIPEALHSKWYTQSADPVINVGQIGHVTIQFRNVGQTAWVRGTAAELRLGEVGPTPLPPAMRVGWPYPDRPAVQTEAVVDPYALGTFTFAVRGVTPGTFRLDLRPVVDGVKWLEDDGVHVNIHVR